MAGWDDIPDVKPKKDKKSGWDDIPNKVESQPTTQKSYTLGQVPGAAISNLPSGMLEYAKTLIDPSTYKGIGEIASSINPAYWGQNYLFKEEYPYEKASQAAGAFAQNLAESYGGWENIKRTMAERPVQVFSDLASSLMGSGALLQRSGKFGKLGSMASKAGQWMEPLSASGKAIELAGEGIKRVVKGPLGISTGAGAVSVEKAMEGSPAFRQALRGKIAGEEVVEASKGGLYAIKSNRGTAYRDELNKIKNLPNAPQMDIANPIREFHKSLKDFGVEMIQGEGGKLDLNFNRSSLRNNPLAQNDFKRVADTLRGAMDDPRYFSSPEGFDILKRQLFDMYKESSQGRVVIERVANNVRQQLIQGVPGYEKMVSGYEKTSNLIKEIERDLSLGNKKSIDTALRKLNSAMREDDNFRRSLITEVEKASGKDISSMVAGRMMTGYMPKGFRGVEIGGLAIMGTIFGHPGLLPLIASASPRIVAETMMLLGQAEKYGKKIIAPTAAPIRQGIYQFGAKMEE